MFFKISLWISLTIFGLGLLYKIVRWFSLNISVDTESEKPLRRLKSALEGFISVISSPKIGIIMVSLLKDGIFQIRLFRESKIRWLAHSLILWGFVGLIIMHALGSVLIEPLTDYYYPTLNPYMFLRNLFMLFVLAGISISIIRRIFFKNPRRSTNAGDVYAILIVAVIVLSGFFLEVTKLSSYSEFKRMVDDYGDFDEEANDLPALESYWIKNYSLVSPNNISIENKELLNRGKDIHEASCSACHANPKWAFLSYGVNRAIKPALLTLDNLKLPSLLWYIHILFTFGGLAYLPFSKMFHIISTPINLIVNGVINEKSAKNNIESSLILSLDACTHCGICTDTCSVGICFEKIPNPNILPSEKIISIKRFFARREHSEEEIRQLLQGLEICTSCLKCTSVCPSGINLQELWFKVKEKLYSMGYAEVSVLSPISIYRVIKLNGKVQLYPSEVAFNTIKKTFKEDYHEEETIELFRVNPSYKKELKSSEQGWTFSFCYNCKTCTVSCPVVRCSDDDNKKESLGLVPHQIMHSLSLGLVEAVFKSPMLWKCLGCYQCQENCPQGVQIADIFYELKNMASEIIRERKKL